MATASPPEPKETECSVCHEPFSEPKLIPCGHLLCRHCVVSWLTSQPDAPCPLCRCAIVEPGKPGSMEPGKPGSVEPGSVEEMVDAFPTDLSMKARVEMEELLSKDHPCEACLKHTATSKCLSCGDLLCASCQAIHGRMRSTRSHSVEKLSALTPEMLAASRTSPCGVHADKPTELFCPTHGTAICLLCAFSRHKGCSDVKDLEEAVKETRAVLRELAATLTTKEEDIDQALEELDRHHEETDKKAKAAVIEIEEACDRLESSIRACCKRLKELVVGACSGVKKAVGQSKALLQQHRGKLTSQSLLCNARKS